jgi:hypothetical protein
VAAATYQFPKELIEILFARADTEGEKLFPRMLIFGELDDIFLVHNRDLEVLRFSQTLVMLSPTKTETVLKHRRLIQSQVVHQLNCFARVYETVLEIGPVLDMLIAT